MPEPEREECCKTCGAPLGWEGERQAAGDLLALADERVKSLERRLDLLSNALESSYRRMEIDQEVSFDPDREILMTLVYRALNPGEP